MNWLLQQISSIYTKYGKKFFILLIVILFFIIYFFNIMSLGPEYDELLAINAALNCPSNVFIETVLRTSTFCFPIMLSPYIGGILALFYRLMFIFFPVSLLMFRLINIAIFFCSLGLLYKSVKYYYDKLTSFYTLLLLCFDFQLWRNIRIEGGTSPFPFFLKSLFIFFISYYNKKGNNLYLLLAFFFMGLSIWAKQDAIFFYFSLTISFLIVNRDKIRFFFKNMRKNFKLILYSFIGLIVGIFPLILYLFKSFSRFISVSTGIGKSYDIGIYFRKMDLFFYQFSSIDAIWFVFREEIGKPFYLTLATVLIWIYFLFACKDALKLKKNMILVYTFIIFTILYFLYGGLISAHHRFLVYPITHLVLALYIKNIQPLYRILFISIYLLIFLFSFIKFQTHLNTVGSIGAYSRNIYRVSKYIDTLDRNILVADWGISTQLVLLVNNPKLINEIAFKFNTNEISGIDQKAIIELEKCDYVLLHKENQAIFKNANRNIRLIFNANLVYTDSVFELYKCRNL